MNPIKKFYRRVLRKLRRTVVSRQAEVYLLSYPKCGRTWLRMLIGQMVLHHFARSYDDPMDLWGLTKRVRGVPRIVVSHDDKPHRRAPEEQQSDKGPYAEKKVILLVRDPRDAMVSNFFHNKYRGRVFSGNLGEYLDRPRGGLASLLSYYNIWASQRSRPLDFLLVRYEDLHSRPIEVMGDIALFLGLTGMETDTIEKAIEASSFNNMRNSESTGEYKRRRLQPGDPTDQRSYKTRKGKAGSYKEEFAPDDLAWLEERIEAALDPFFDVYRYKTEL